MKTFFKILLLAAVVTSCDDVEPTIFHGDDPAEQTFLTFSSGTYNLPVERDAQGTLTVTLNVSTVATVDRTYNIEVIPETANPNTYIVPVTSLTVPAYQYNVSFDITGQDNGLVDDEVKTFKIKIADASISDESTGFTESTINVYEVCPLQSPFLGVYRVTGTSLFQDLYPFGNNSNVVLQEGSNPYERVFSAPVYVGYGSAQQIKINFQCDYLNLGNTLDSRLGCGEEDSEGESITIILKPADNEDRSPYNTFNDATFTMSFRENTAGACNAPSELSDASFVKQ